MANLQAHIDYRNGVPIILDMKTTAPTLRETMTLNISKPTDPQHLRALYAEIKAGAPMPHALVRAAISGLADPGCAEKARKAFEALGLDYRTAADVDDLDAAVARGDYVAIVRLTSGSNDMDYSSLWAAAMTAHYGPTGLHDSRRREDGTPDPEKCSDCPSVAREMGEAAERCVKRVAILRWRLAREAA